MTRMEELNKKYHILNNAGNRAFEAHSSFWEILKRKAQEILDLRWNMSIEQAQQDYLKRQEHICNAAGIHLKVLGGNKNKIEIGVYDWETRDEVTWGELIERMNGRKSK